MSEVNPECKAQISPPTKIIWTYLFFCTHTHQSVMNVKIEQKPLVDAAWVIITCCRSVNGGSTFSVCRSCNCNNKLLFRLECYQKKKKKDVDHVSQRTLLLWPFNYLGANWTQVFTMFKEFRALSLYEVCHSYLSKSDVAIRAFTI